MTNRDLLIIIVTATISLPVGVLGALWVGREPVRPAQTEYVEVRRTPMNEQEVLMRQALTLSAMARQFKSEGLSNAEAAERIRSKTSQASEEDS